LSAINITKSHPILQTLIHLAPSIKKCFFNDVTISVSDLDTIVYQLNPDSDPTQTDTTGNKLTPQDPMYDVLRQKKGVQLSIPKELYGYALRLAINPIFNEKNELIGSIGISRLNNDQANLVEVSQAFSSSSEELNSSADELANSANTLATFMNHVNEAQQNLSRQVLNSTKILDMINNVAKNTRILGFNAGIEAARSGEHGKGFAVVAREITKLADQSADSVNDIRSLLHSMKEKVDEVTKTVNDTIDLANSQVHTTEEMVKAIEQLTNVAKKIDALAHKL